MRWPRVSFRLRAPRLPRVRLPHSRRGRWLLLGAAAGVFLLILAGGWLGYRRLSSKPPPVTTPIHALTVSTAAAIDAGQPLTLTIAANPPVSGTQVLVAAQGTMGPAVLTGRLVDGAVTLVIPGTQTQAAGRLDIVAAAGDATAKTFVDIRPLAAADPMLMLAGPSSVSAGSAKPVQVVSIPLDALGNPIVDGNSVTVQVEHPPASWLAAGARQMISATTRSLLSNATIQARHFAGMLTAAAATSASHSPARRVLISPSAPVNINVTATPRSVPADGRTLITLDTGILQDRYGNQLMDGMLVTFVVTGEDGERRTLPATTLDGHAMLRMRAPKTPTAQTVVATLGDQVSEPLTLYFSTEAAFAPFTVAATTTDGSVAFVAGPILGALDQLVADDTPVVFTLVAPNGAVAVETMRTLNGYASYEKPADLMQAGVYTVTAASGGAQSSLLYEVSADGE